MRFYTVQLDNGASYQAVGTTDAEAKATVKNNMSKFPFDLQSSIEWECEGEVDGPDGDGRPEKMYCPLKNSR